MRDDPATMPRRTHAALYAYASQRRAELFSALNRMSLLRKHGPNPWSRELRAQNVSLIKAANVYAPKVLP